MTTTEVPASMPAAVYRGSGEVAVEDRPVPSPGPGEVLVEVDRCGICGSDLHIYHGRVPVEAGFTIGHEFVGTVLAVGGDVERVAEGDRVLGCFHTACGTCRACLRGDYHRCERGRIFGHGSKLGDLQGAQAELLLVPRADLTLRRVPERVSDEVDESLAILNGRDELTSFGELLHEAWQAKRSLSARVSNSDVDQMYECARSAGAVGGKLAGAGGGGFLLLFVPPECQAAVREQLNTLIHVPFRFEFSGSQILFADTEQEYQAEEAARALRPAPAFRELKMQKR